MRVNIYIILIHIIYIYIYIYIYIILYDIKPVSMYGGCLFMIKTIICLYKYFIKHILYIYIYIVNVNY